MGLSFQPARWLDRGGSLQREQLRTKGVLLIRLVLRSPSKLLAVAKYWEDSLAFPRLSSAKAVDREIGKEWQTCEVLSLKLLSGSRCSSLPPQTYSRPALGVSLLSGMTVL